MPAFGPDFISPSITLLAKPITAATGTTSLIAGVAGQRIYVYGYQLSAYKAPYVWFVDGVSILTGAVVATAAGASVAPPSFLFATAAGAGLSITSTPPFQDDAFQPSAFDGAITVFGTVFYWQG